MNWRIECGDVRERLAMLPDASVQTCVTSPPYWGLRDYGHAGQIGLEATPAAYVAALVAVFAAVRRVLKDDGTLWLNLGDSYSGSGKGGNPDEGKQATNKGSQSIGVLYGKTGETAREAALTNVSRRWTAEARHRAEESHRHPVARGFRAASGRLVSPLGHHLEQAEPDAGVGDRPSDEGA